ncbi:hypothetical protein NG895_14865 [Aeoliella sp. ICT_H6.2]|uniref:IPT/TIG domain-containing protein n=1 Tax=Aeoliella straminimaris TaxID=2954799 RepID=A0A9X2JGX0_9BACT|nr:hypothetical protein [Aeoliella straminimaris]MCO6045191.1 hypothetical protein [Aeoliella straminimaris]
MSRYTLPALAVIVVALAATNSASAGCGGKKYYGGASNLHHRYISSHHMGVYRTHHKPVVVERRVVVEKPVIVEKPVVVQQPVPVPAGPIAQPGFPGGIPQGQPGFGGQPQGFPQGFPQGGPQGGPQGPQPGFPQGQPQQNPNNGGGQPGANGSAPQMNIRQAQRNLPSFAVGSRLTLDGQEFGGKPGQVLMVLGPMELPIAVADWTPSEVTIQLPELPLKQAADARIVILNSEGKLINQSELKLTPKANRLAMGD